jgi:hypothetical protein
MPFLQEPQKKTLRKRMGKMNWIFIPGKKGKLNNFYAKTIKLLNKFS